MLIKISKKIAVLLMKLPSLLMAEKIEPKILLIDKAVVTLLIRSFFNNGELFANCTYTISCYIIARDEQNRRKEQPANTVNGNQKSFRHLKGAKTIAR